jgi:hypothetical protein
VVEVGVVVVMVVVVVDVGELPHVEVGLVTFA